MDTQKTEHLNLLEALDLGALTDEEQEDLLVEINDLVYEATMVRIIEKMDDKTLEEYEKLIDSDAPVEEIDQFISKNVPDSDKLMQDSIEELIGDILFAQK